jgi:hypothetical protein
LSALENAPAHPPPPKSGDMSAEQKAPGRSARPRRHRDAVPFTGVVAGTAAVCLFTLAVAVIHVSYAGQAARHDARRPVFHVQTSPQPPTALWHAGFDTVAGRQVSVVAIAPLIEDAPLPPGVHRWPAPGEAVLSPALAEAGLAEGIGTRYGHVTGHIGEAGLAGPGEKLAYVRPKAASVATANMHPITGYGADGELGIGDALTARPERMMLALTGGLLGLPALGLLLVAAQRPRPGAQTTVPDVHDRGALRRVHAGGPAVGLGGLAGLTVLLSLLSMDVRVPVVGHVIAASDLRVASGQLLVAWAAGVLLALLAVAAAVPVTPARPPAAASPSPRRGTTRLAVLFPVMVLVTVRAPGLFATDSPARTWIYYAGVAGTLVTLPAVIHLIAGGRARRCLSIAPVAFVLVAGVIVVTQVQLWFGAVGAPVRAAQEIRNRVGDSAQVVNVDGAAPAELTRFFAALPPETRPLRLVSDGDAALRLVGLCPALTTVQLRCSETPVTVPRPARDRRVDAALAWYAGDTTYVTAVVENPATTPSSPSALIVVTPQGSDLPPTLLTATAYRTLPLGATVHPVGAEWLTSAALQSDQARWILLVGSAGLFVLSAACGVHLLLRHSQRDAVQHDPVQNDPVMHDAFQHDPSVRSLTSTARAEAASTLLVFAAAGATGVVIAAWLAAPMAGPGGIPAASWPSFLAVTSGVGAAVWATAVGHDRRLQPRSGRRRREFSDSKPNASQGRDALLSTNCGSQPNLVAAADTEPG